MEDDIQNYLSTVMFRGTPCMKRLYWLSTKLAVSYLENVNNYFLEVAEYSHSKYF